MIRNVVFDLGNVLLNFDPDSYLDELGYSGEIKERLKAEIFKTEEWLMLDRGTITQAEALKRWKNRNQDLKDKIEDVMAEWEAILSLKKKKKKILKKEKEKV